MGKCFSKQDKGLKIDAIDVRYVQPVHSSRYASSRLIQVFTEQAIIEYRLSLSPTHASSNDSSLRGCSSAHSHRNQSTPMAQHQRTNVRLHIDRK